MKTRFLELAYADITMSYNQEGLIHLLNMEINKLFKTFLPQVKIHINFWQSTD